MVGAVVCITLFTGIIGTIIGYPVTQQEPYSFFSYFIMGKESTIPAFISSFILLLSSLLLLVAAMQPESKMYINRRLCYFLSLIIFVVSVNEIAGLHHIFSGYLTGLATLFATPQYASSAVAAAGLLLFLLCFCWSFYKLPSRFRKSFLLSGLVFASGAFGAEAAGAFVLGSKGSFSMLQIATMVAEESLELLGILFFFKALLAYISGVVELPENIHELQKKEEVLLMEKDIYA